jgi:hypothetical protein
MQNEVEIGQNRTGTAMSPRLTAEMVAGTGEFVPQSASVSDRQAIAVVRATYAREASQVGSLPPPVTLGGMASAAVQGVRGTRPAQFLDKLGERLAFERTGTRLYEAVIAKLDVADPHPGGPTHSDLELIRNAEHRHFAMLRDALLQLGADPTAMTPCADLVAVAGLGWVQAITDPRTTLNQCLDILLIAELADQGGWELLIALAEQLELDDLAHQFQAALVEEGQHVLRVRGWVTAAVLGEAGVESGDRTQTGHLPR